MDISKASNFERFLFDLAWRDPAVVRELMQKVDHEGGFDLSTCDQLWGRVPKFGFASGRSTHAARLEGIKAVANRYGIEIDPHTADGYNVGSTLREPSNQLILLETALPAKFADTIQEALGKQPSRPAALAGIEALPQRVAVIPASVERLKEAIARACAPLDRND